MVQIKVSNPEKQRKVLRAMNTLERKRGDTTVRWGDNVAIISKTSLDFSLKNRGWLGL